MGAYRASPYGVRWYGDFRGAVPGKQHLFCLDLRFWYASRAYRYRRAPAAHLRNRDGVHVAAAERHRIAYAIWTFGRSSSPARQAAVMLYVHSQMGDARPGELDVSGRSLSLEREVAHASARDAGPYRVEMQLPARLVVGQAASATIRVLAAGGRALPNVSLALSTTGASAPARARTDSAGVARFGVVPAAVAGLSVTVRTGPLASTEPEVFVPTAPAARANGQRLALPASQRVVRTFARAGVVAAPQLSVQASAPNVAVGSTVEGVVGVTRLGGASTSVQVSLWGPYATPSEVTCSGASRWSGSFVASGDTTTTTAPVQLDHAGYYGYSASIAAQSAVAGATTACAATAAVAHPVLTTTASAAVVRPAERVADHIEVRGVGTTPIHVEAELYGPFASRAEIRCDTSHLVWRGGVTVAGNGTVRTKPVALARAGFYGYRESVPAGPVVAGTATECAPAEETALAAPRIVTGRGDVASFVSGRGGAPTRPARIRIDSLAIDAPVESSAIDVPHGVLGIPSDIHRTGWWRDGAAPGDAAGTVLVAGHVDSAGGGLGAFFSLRRARVGDRVELDTSSGRTFDYRVESVRMYPKSALPTDVFSTTGKPRLVLVTCGGAFDASSGHYPDDVVVTAVPA